MEVRVRRFKKYALIAVIAILIFAIGIKVHFVLTAPRVSDWNYHQLQRIDHSRTNFSFAVFGDNKNSGKEFENLISRLNEDNVLFAIDNGDLVYDGEVGKFSFFLNQIKKLNEPLLTVFGNHDAEEGGRAIYYDLFGPFYYSFVIGNSYFIVLDDSNETRLDDEQFVWLKKQLKLGQGYENRFVFMHVPLYDPRKGSYKAGHSLKDLAFAKKLNDLFDESNVTMLFVSHIHGYYRGKWHKTPYIISGGGGAELAGSDPKHYFYHYIRVDVNGSNVAYKLVKLGNSDFELIDRGIHITWVYIYSFFASHFVEGILLVVLAYLGAYIVSDKFGLDRTNSL